MRAAGIKSILWILAILMGVYGVMGPTYHEDVHCVASITVVVVVFMGLCDLDLSNVVS